MQKNNVDSIGLGKQVRNSMRYEQWKKLNWDKVYPRLTVNCKVEMIIKDSGKFE